jgi:hypothetical protein
MLAAANIAKSISSSSLPELTAIIELLDVYCLCNSMWLTAGSAHYFCVSFVAVVHNAVLVLFQFCCTCIRSLTNITIYTLYPALKDVWLFTVLFAFDVVLGTLHCCLSCECCYRILLSSSLITIDSSAHPDILYYRPGYTPGRHCLYLVIHDYGTPAKSGIAVL